MLDTLCHLLYVSIDRDEIGQNSSVFQSFNQNSEQNTETLNKVVVSQLIFYQSKNKLSIKIMFF